jgi:hypothetical protein
MAQVTKPTQKLYIAAALAIQGGAHDAATHICLDKASMAAFAETTNAAGSEASESGLARAAATVTVTTGTAPNNGINNVCQALKAFTCGVTPTAVYGFLVMTATPAGNCLMWCAFASVQNLENGDILTCTGKMEFQKETTS